MFKKEKEEAYRKNNKLASEWKQAKKEFNNKMGRHQRHRNSRMEDKKRHREELEK